MVLGTWADLEPTIRFESWSASVVGHLGQTKTSIQQYRVAATDLFPLSLGRRGTTKWLAETMHAGIRHP